MPSLYWPTGLIIDRYCGDDSDQKKDCGQGRRVSRFGLAVRRKAGKPKGIGSIPLRLSFLFKKVVVCGHRLVILSLTIDKTLKCLPSLPTLMQESLWW